MTQSSDMTMDSKIKLLNCYTYMMTTLLQMDEEKWVKIEDVMERFQIPWFRAFVEKVGMDGANWLGEVSKDESNCLYLHPRGIRRALLKAFSDNIDKSFSKVMILYFTRIEQFKADKLKIKLTGEGLHCKSDDTGLTKIVLCQVPLLTPTNSSKNLDSNLTPYKKKGSGVKIFGLLKDGSKFVVRDESTYEEKADSKKRKIKSKILLDVIKEGKVAESLEVKSLSAPSDAIQSFSTNGESKLMDEFLKK